MAQIQPSQLQEAILQHKILVVPGDLGSGPNSGFTTNIVGAVAGQILEYNGSNWFNTTAVPKLQFGSSYNNAYVTIDQVDANTKPLVIRANAVSNTTLFELQGSLSNVIFSIGVLAQIQQVLTGAFNSLRRTDAGPAFDITNNVDANMDFYVTQPGAGDKFGFVGPTTNTALVLGQNNTERMRVHSNGKVGVNNNSPAFQLDVTGDINTTTAYRAGGTVGINATITTAKLTPGGANGSMTFVGGILTAQTPAT